jgi:beta-mannosidase
MNTFFFKPAKELNLPRPSIEATVTKSASGFKLSLQSDILAKNVNLSTEKIEGFFTDNYFHLIPGQAVEVEFQAKERMELAEFKNELTVTSLVDASAAMPAL